MAVLSRAAASIERISTGEAFEALAGEWDDLVRAMPRPSPFMLHGWLAEWWRHYGQGAELAVVVARDDGRLVGALPLVVRRRAGLRVASFMGDRLAVLPDLLLSEDADESVSGRLTEWLAGGGCHVADFHGLPAESRIAAALGPRLGVTERCEAPVLDLAAGWDEVYRAKTTSKKRNLHRRRRRQLGELGELTVSVAREPDELAFALEDAFWLHALRWEGRPDGSGFTTPIGMDFHRAALRRLAAGDVARIITLRVDRRPIAFHYWFALAGCMYVHRLAFDPAVGRWSPGVVNTLDAIEAAAEEGMTRVEFLGGGERYKVELADEFAPLYHGFGVASGLRGRAYAAAHIAEIRTRLALKRSPRVHRLYFDDLAPARRLAQRMRARSISHQPSSSDRTPRSPGTR
jgi:CelD/BcsL family acetyltransferase involved in cellulose biosynthesis